MALSTTDVTHATKGAASATDPTAERTFRLTTSLPGHRDMVFTCALADLPGHVRRAFDPAGTGTEVEVSADGSTATVVNPDGTPGLVFTVTADTDPATVDPRRAAFDLAVAGVAAGLPVPGFVGVGDDLVLGRLELHLPSDDPAGVDRWAAWLGLPAPSMILRPMSTSGGDHATGWFQPYEAQSFRHEVTGGWVVVKSYMTVDAPNVCEPANTSDVAVEVTA